jgi:hypothetical protein
MSILHIPTVSDGGGVESTDLKTHVLLCGQRYGMLSDRLDRIEKSIDDIIQTSKENKKIIIGAFVTVVTGTATSLITIFLKLSQ